MPVTASQRLLAPTLVGAAGWSAAAMVLVRDPHTPGSYGTCPFLAVTGLPCPGCGGLRAVSDLAAGDVAGAVSSNALVVVLVLAVVGAWAAWIVAAAGRVIILSSRPTAVWGCVALGVVLAFGVVRNLPFGAALAP